MKKKIRDLEYKEMVDICNEHYPNRCEICPLYFGYKTCIEDFASRGELDLLSNKLLDKEVEL